MEDDVLIVGGGVIGLSLAYELSGTGWRVRLIDANEPAGEASWAGAGILPPPATRLLSHPLDQLRALSYRLHGEWADQLLSQTGIDNGYRRCGGLYVATTAGEAAALSGIREAWIEEGIQVEMPGLSEVRRLLGRSQEDVAIPIKTALMLPGEAQIRNPRHLQALQKACQIQGVTIESSCPATGFRQEGPRISAVDTTLGERRARMIVISAGPWSQQLLQRLAVSVDILPVRGQMLLFRCRRPPFQCIVNHGSRYLVPRDDGHVLAGSTEEEVGFDRSTTEEAVRELLTFAQSLHPELNRTTLQRSWAGLRPATYDGVPYVGRLGQIENGFVAAGHFRTGLFLAPATARVLGQLMRGETPEVDLSHLRATRG